MYSGGMYGARRGSMTVQDAWKNDIVDVILNGKSGYLTKMSCGSFLFINEKNGERAQVNKNKKVEYTRKGGVYQFGQNSPSQRSPMYSGGMYERRQYSNTANMSKTSKENPSSKIKTTRSECQMCGHSDCWHSSLFAPAAELPPQPDL
tara:strand:+ start:4544 stop:4987 length:444 start_codon:yes stop_codon:yes gene_type:complete